MPVELRLAVRLFRGTRGRDLVRYAAIAIAAALIGLAVTLGLCVALLGTHEARVQAARAPVRSDTTTGLWLAESTELLEGRQWTRVVVSASVAGIGPPEGLSAWPAPGASAVSPALAELLRRPEYGGMAGTVDPAVTLDARGLISPSELYSYTVLEPGTSFGAAYREIAGFARSPDPADDGGALAMLVVVVLILAVPAVLSFNSAFRFLLTSRAQRYGILMRIGVPERQIARMFAAECALLTGAGLGLGFGAFALTQATIGANGWLALTWWPASGDLPIPIVVVVAMAATLMAWHRGSRMIRSTHPRRVRDVPGPSWKSGRLAGSLIVVSASYLLGILAYWLATPTTLRQPGPLTMSILLAVALGTVGLTFGMPRWSRAAARRLATRSPTPGVRLGLRGAAFFSASGSRFLLALVLLSVLSGGATGFITGVGRWGAGYVATQVLEVDDLSTLDPTTVSQLMAELNTPFVVLGYTSSDAVVVAGSCAGVAAFDRLARPSPGECREGQIQTGDELGLATPPPHRISLDPTAPAVDIPTSGVTANVRWSVKLPSGYLLRASRMDGASLMIPLADDANAVRTIAFFNERFPQIPVQAGIKDPDSYDVYTHYSSIFRIAFGAAVVITAAALALLALELAWSNARQTSALAAIGLGRRELRIATTTQAAWPVIAAIPGVGFGILAGIGVRSYFGTTDLLEPAIFGAVTVPWILAILLAAAAGVSAAVVHFRRDKISDT